MSDSPCPCDSPVPVQLDILAGLDALPRQTRTFPIVRRALLEGVSAKTALEGWRSRGGRDLGLMLLEMWAYVTDVLNFYDERIADESYVRTSKRRPSLRRLVDLLGYVPTPGGIAGKATIAAIADGRNRVTLPPQTAFRSDGFGDEPPQVFETTTEIHIHPFQNQWQVGPLKRGLVRQRTPSRLPGQPGASLARTRFFVFESAGLNLVKDQLALFEFLDEKGQVTSRKARKVVGVKPFTGKDGVSYQEVEVHRHMRIDKNLTVAELRVRTPTVKASLNNNATTETSPRTSPAVSSLHVLLDNVYNQIRVSDPIIVANDSAGQFGVGRVAAVSEQPVEIPVPDQETTATFPDDFATEQKPPVVKIDAPPPTKPVTLVELKEEIRRVSMSPETKNQLTVHFGFVSAGNLTSVGDTLLTRNDLTRDGGLPVLGFAETPPKAANTLKLQQQFLLVDADDKGALVDGKLVFDGAGRATFQVTNNAGLTEEVYKTPITVFGNLVSLTRGESVVEVLGNGDARQPNQKFTLKKKPLTYLETAKNALGVESTLGITVTGKAWTEVKNFFDRGPQEEIYTVRHDDEKNTVITFGDGVRGARLPSGQNNVVARYRFGAGRAAPPANALQQIARPVTGLRSARSPIAAIAGHDPEPADALRTRAPRSVLAFGRAVSIRDIEAYAMLKQGVLKASAEFVWIESEMHAGVEVTYIGEIAEDVLAAYLRNRVEENLPLQVNQAVGRPSTIEIDVVRDKAFDRERVEHDVRKILSDEASGVLAPINAEIGGRLWISQIYEQVQAVEGVLGVRNMVLRVRGISQETALDALEFEAQALSRRQLRLTVEALGKKIDRSLGIRDVLCTPAGTYFDFAGSEGVIVTAPEKGTTPNQLPRHLEET